MKTDDADWVEDVRRWYFNGGRPSAPSAPKPLADDHAAGAAALSEIGYEAAHPGLQSSAWSKLPASRFGTLG